MTAAGITEEDLQYPLGLFANYLSPVGRYEVRIALGEMKLDALKQAYETAIAEKAALEAKLAELDPPIEETPEETPSDGG